MEQFSAPRTPGAGAMAQTVALVAVAMLAGLTLGLTALSVLGVTPWPEIDVRYGGVALPRAGMAAQIAFTVFCVGLCFFLPASRRILHLERTHRDFHIAMDDIARAYRASHAADRKGLFRAASEFDSVRERIAHLRAHPDLGALEPGVLEVAAQMSHEARDLAATYSDANVERARTFLRQRQEEAQRLTDTIAAARTTCDQIKHWLLEVQTEEALVQRQLARLEGDLLELLPQLGFETTIEIEKTDDGTVIPMNRRIGEQAPRRMPRTPPAPDV